MNSIIMFVVLTVVATIIAELILKRKGESILAFAGAFWKDARSKVTGITSGEKKDG